MSDGRGRPIEPAKSDRFDAIVIGTGFGGAVVAARLSQAGYHICVLERGRRYESRRLGRDGEPVSDLPRLPTSDRIFPDFTRWSWAADGGLWDVRDLGDAYVAQAAAYGGGSIIYANVHLRPPKDVFAQGWPDGYRLLEREPRTPAERDQSLDRYYDLAASMLDVKPITEAPFVRSLVKTDQMAKVARAIERSEDFFYPPLAINFERKTNAFGVDQEGCKACGECDTGCRHGAKNTLDLNYLKIVEQSGRADVRTQAEVEIVNRFEDRDDSYEVRYRDHLCGGEVVRIRSRYVFVCAGAVNSTELLLRSRAAARRARDVGDATDPGLPALTGKDSPIGQGYSANADALGMVYEASLPPRFDHESADGPVRTPRDLAPSVGPVITTCMTYRDERNPNLFLLLQEGGFPEALARHVGLMRAPIFFRRNRYERADSTIEVVDGSPPPPDGAAVDALASSLGFDPRGGLLSLPDGVLRLLEGGDLHAMVPPQLRNAVRVLAKELGAVREQELGLVVSDVIGHLIERDAVRWARTFTLRKSPPDWALSWARRILTFIYGVVAPVDRVTKVTDDAVRERYAPTAQNVGRALRYLTSFTDQRRIHSRQSLVLLAMGRDETAGTISLDDDSDLRITLSAKHDAQVHAVGELLMRDVAAAVRGKLRVNPLWAFGRKPISVHSQGGCGMSADPAKGAADGNGEVHGCRGLYVVDAAAFPRPVGVNPSATIAAIAERNVRRFIATHPPPGTAQTTGNGAGYDDASWDRENWKRADDWRESARTWLNGEGGTPASGPRARLSPPEPTSPKRPTSEPIGITFIERLSGFHGDGPSSLDERDRPEQPYEYGAIRGRPGQTLSLLLKVTVPDLAMFMRDKNRTVSICGVARLSWPALGMKGRFRVSGEMHLPATDAALHERKMTYALCLGQKERWATMSGVKWLKNDPGPDAWHDATTLYVDLASGGARSKGTLHVAMNHFLFRQLRSLRVHGTDDPARIVWAVSAFATYFFGALQRVYVPELQKIVDLVDHIELR